MILSSNSTGANGLDRPTACPLTNSDRTKPQPDDADFAYIADAWHGSGGLKTADEIALALRNLSRGGVGDVARWIVKRKVLNVYWRGTYWVPNFQFVPATMLMKQPVSAVLDELAPVLSDWDLCLWFATPTAWLGERSPAQALGSEPSEVFQAARTHRYVLVG